MGDAVRRMCHVVPHDLALSDIGIIMSKRIPEIPLRVVLMRDFLTSPWACAIDMPTILCYPALSCTSLITEPRRLDWEDVARPDI